MSVVGSYFGSTLDSEPMALLLLLVPPAPSSPPPPPAAAAVVFSGRNTQVSTRHVKQKQVADQQWPCPTRGPRHCEPTLLISNERNEGGQRPFLAEFDLISGLRVERLEPLARAERAHHLGTSRRVVHVRLHH